MGSPKIVSAELDTCYIEDLLPEGTEQHDFGRKFAFAMAQKDVNIISQVSPNAELNYGPRHY